MKRRNPELSLALRRQLNESEQELLVSASGYAAFQLLLPIFRELVIYLEGGGARPKILDALPELKSPAALERLALRKSKG